jgi:hypothetical protein
MAQSFDTAVEPHSSRSAVAWPAIIAGAFVAAGATLILLALGSGLGFASISPWSDRGVSATAFTITAAIWLLVTQWLSAGLGGYIAGRLRTRWSGTHVHEVFFRDTAHGLVTWAVATVLVAAVAASSVASVTRGGARALSEAAPAAAHGAAHGMTSTPFPGVDAYDVDELFRSSTATTNGAGGADPRLEAAHIAAHAMTTGMVSDDDRKFLGDLVAERAGLPQAEAQKRVDDFMTAALHAETKAKADADLARKAAAETSLYIALSLLVGAFIACVAAALGGQQRDLHL